LFDGDVVGGKRIVAGAQQHLGTTILAPPQWIAPVPLSWNDNNLCSYGHHQLLNPERRDLGVRKNQATPFMLQYEWKLNRDEVGVSGFAGELNNYERWNQSPSSIPPSISILPQPRRQYIDRGGFIDAHEHRLWSHAALKNWAELINDSSTHSTMYYRILREPDLRNTEYIGAVAYLPHIQVQAKSVVELEAKLLSRYIEYTKHIELMLQPLVDTTELTFAF